MAISFPIPENVQQTIFGSMLASMHHRPELAGALRDRMPLMFPPGDPEEFAAQLQQHLYQSTLNDFLGARRRFRSDIYAVDWFVLGFHGWLGSAKLEGFDDPPWLGKIDHEAVLRDALFELGIETDRDAIAEALRDARALPEHEPLQKIDDRVLYFADRVAYLSSAAIRGGHRTGLHAPAASAFISYAHADADQVNGMANFLEQHAVNVWLDADDLRSGARLDGRLRAGIERQEVFVVVLSEASLQSRWVMQELAAALELGKRIVPVSVVSTEALNELTRQEGGAALYEGVMAFPVVWCEHEGWMAVYRKVLQNLQNTELDITRWRQDEGSALAAFLGSRRAPEAGQGL